MAEAATGKLARNQLVKLLIFDSLSLLILVNYSVKRQDLVEAMVEDNNSRNILRVSPILLVILEEVPNSCAGRLSESDAGYATSDQAIPACSWVP